MAKGKLQVTCIVNRQTMFFGEREDRLRLRYIERRFDVDGQTLKLFPKKRKLPCFYPFSAECNQQTI